MTPSRQEPRGTYLPTGWRLVGGKAAALVEEMSAPAAVEAVTPGDPTQTLYGVECTTSVAASGRPAVERILEILSEDLRRSWPDAPRLVRDREVDHPASRFGGARFQFLAQPGSAWVGELVWRSVHPLVPGAPMTTRVIIEETAHFTRLGVRVTADDGLPSVRGYVGAGQAQPPFLQTLLRTEGLIWLGAPVGHRVLGPGSIEDFVRSVLEAPDRSFPVALLAPREEGGGHLVQPEALARDLVGRAQLHVIHDHRLTFDLTEAVRDRRMSCFRGAVRCYYPGWTRNDDPYDHPLLLGERLEDPLMRAGWLGEVGQWLGRRVVLPAAIDERRARTLEAKSAAPSTGSTTTATGKIESSDSGIEAADGATPDLAPPTPDPAGTAVAKGLPQETLPSPALHALMEEVSSLGSLVENLLGTTATLVDELERLRTISAVRSSSTNAIERRLGRLEDLLERYFGLAVPVTPDAGLADSQSETEVSDEGGPSLVDVVRDVAEAHGDALLVLDSAFRGAAESPYEDPERVRALLDAMAHVARRRMDGSVGTSLREAFSNFGIDYRSGIASTTSAKLRQQYQFTAPSGEPVEAEEHIVLGKTYDPRRCLRVYFSSRVNQEVRFVIGHVGRHFEVISST